MGEQVKPNAEGRMDFSHYLFRCSALGHLMAEEKGKSNFDIWLEAKAKHEQATAKLLSIKQFDKSGSTMKSYQNQVDRIEVAKVALDDAEKTKDIITLSEGAKTHLLDIYISEKYGRRRDIDNKYIQKGLQVEEDGITLYSRIKRVFFKKNEKDMKNLFIKGTPDSFIGKIIHEAERIIDIKCSWDIVTFFRTFTKTINSLYYWQGMGYMWLTGAKYFDLSYCLVNTPESFIEAEKRSVWYKMGHPDETADIFTSACKQIELNMRYDDIPLRERMLEYTIERDEQAIELLKRKIVKAREYLNWLDNEFTLKFAA